MFVALFYSKSEQFLFNFTQTAWICVSLSHTITTSLTSHVLSFSSFNALMLPLNCAEKTQWSSNLNYFK